MCVCCRQLCAANNPHKSTQTETSLFGSSSCTANGTSSSAQADDVLPACNCDAKTTFNDLRAQLQHEHDDDKDKALKSLEERVGMCCHFMCSLSPFSFSVTLFCQIFRGMKID